MSKLSGSFIKDCVDSGHIVIEPFNIENLGPNSYDLTLSDKIKTYDRSYSTISPDTKNVRDVASYMPIFERCLDPKLVNKTKDHIIPCYGTILHPGKLYLACTNEVAGSNKYVPCIEGRSSYARLGIQVHMTAGFGDIGFIGQWTLEISVVEPVRIYPNIRICQVYFDDVRGATDINYADRKSSKYANARGVGASKAYKDFSNR